MMTNREIENLIAKHLSGEANALEQGEFRLWLNSNAKNQREFKKIALAYQLSKGKSIDNRKSAVISKIRNKIDSEKREKQINASWKKSLIGVRVWVSIAASLLVLISIGFLYYLNSDFSGQLADATGDVIVKSNPAGQKSKIFLPDGSIVWLNSESSISYEREFSDSIRDIRLTGEAYFEVVKDANRPFIVYSGSISTTALGTAFDIDAFDENSITVALTQGRVNVRNTDEGDEDAGFVINAGEGVLYKQSEAQQMSIIKIDPERVRLWRDGLLELDNASLAQTVTELERWYGVDIVFLNDPRHVWNANGLFDNEYLENVLTSLSFSQGFGYEIIGKKVNITFK